MVAVTEIAANRVGTATLMGNRLTGTLKLGGVIISVYWWFIFIFQYLLLLGCDWILSTEL
jgi:hypothetical protein